MSVIEDMHDALIDVLDRFERKGHTISEIAAALIAAAASYATTPVESDGHSDVAMCGLCFIREAADCHNRGMAELATEPQEAPDAEASQKTEKAKNDAN